MTWINSMQDILTVLDQYLPWLLPSMESIESAFPIQSRLLVCVLLVFWLVVMRQRAGAGTGMRLEPGS
ncbi:MAG: hypothetical protein V3T72_03375 [Thermoanaerobaculia bacterium]